MLAAGVAAVTSFVLATIPPEPDLRGIHAEVCSLRFGALYCSCGSDINGHEGPIFERRWWE